MLKAGIHYGPCIAVNLDGRLDYFGSTVNIAARLDKLSHGGDVVISDAMRADPEVGELLGVRGLTAERFRETIRGVEDLDFELWRVKETGG
jgi:class 3 adenylate cyclase